MVTNKASKELNQYERFTYSTVSTRYNNNYLKERSTMGEQKHNKKKSLLKYIDSILPINKAKKELFWVKELLKHLPLNDQQYDVLSNKDDSNGNHDVVIIDKSNQNKIGVQVTELISSTRKRVELIRTRYIQKILKALKKQKISSSKKVTITLLFDTESQEQYNPNQITHAIENILDLLQGKTLPNASIQADTTLSHLPNINNIALNIHFKQSLRTLENYMQTLKNLISKKQNSKSPWLLIWSMDFWQDRESLGDDIIEQMKILFENSSFEKVYFIESMEFDFEGSLRIYRVK